MQAQQRRRLGEIVFFTDLANSRMSCDACHPEGHDGGILYEKTHPLHIYRVPTLRGVRETAPYFTPRLLPSLRETARSVLGRNRFHNPNPSAAEIDVARALPGDHHAAPEPLSRGATGDFRPRSRFPTAPRARRSQGCGSFEGKAGCIGCHPPPQFTTDQDPSTRGRLHDVGTPITLPLRLGAAGHGTVPPAAAVAGGCLGRLSVAAQRCGRARGESRRVAIEARHSFALRHVLDHARPASSR